MQASPKQIVFQELENFLARSQHPLLVIMGPTASGKTKLAVELAKKVRGEVINADSRQVYMEMEIGNELTKPEEMQGIPHHLLSFVPLSKHYSVAEYKKDAEQKIENIHSRGKVPLLCGGTMLWTEAVVENYVIPAGEPDWQLRTELEKLSTDELLTKLKAVDPESAKQLAEEKNPRYIIRALEIYEQTGQKKSDIAYRADRKYDVFKLAPWWAREDLYQRINERTRYQFEHGMTAEVQTLVDKYAHGNVREFSLLNWPGLTSIGCKEVIPYLLGEASAEETITLLSRNNRRYSKRQMTWLRKDSEIHWVDGNSI